MDEEKPHSLRSLLTRIVCTLIGLLLLCVLSVGPAGYISQRYPSTYPAINRLFNPILSVIYKTPLHDPLLEYFWAGEQFAYRHSEKARAQTPPAPP